MSSLHFESAGWLASIVARSSSLLERSRGEFLPVEHSGGAAERRWQHWRDAIGGDDARFDRRIRWSGLGREAWLRRLESVSIVPGRELPAWAEILRDALGRCHPKRGVQDGDFGPKETSYTFGEALAPFVEAGSARLGPRRLDLLSDQAYDDFAALLLRRLSKIAKDTLLLRFTVFCRLPPAWTVSESVRHAQYNTFVAELLGGGWRSIIDHYPVLGRLLADCVDRWVRSLTRFLEHLEEDHAALAELGGPDTARLPVAAIRTGLSDPHHGGQAVIGARLAGGVRLIYKPRSLAMEKRYYELLHYASRTGLGDFRTPWTVDCGDHGWQEHVSYEPCGQDLLPQFYWRAGAQLCLIHALQGTDCHLENLIAHGEHPYFIDLETLLTPSLIRFGPLDENDIGGRCSVLHSGLLPDWAYDQAYAISFDISGLAGKVAQMYECRRAAADAGQGSLSFPVRPDPDPPSVGQHSPEPGDPAGAFQDHITYVKDGFRTAYSWLQEHHESLLANDGPIAAFAGSAARVLIRPTQSYGNLIALSLQPRFLRDGADRSIFLESAGRPLLHEERHPPTFDVFLAELEDIETMDVPHVAIDPGGRDLDCGRGRRVAGGVRDSGLVRCRRYLESLGPQDCEDQIELIEATMDSSATLLTNLGGSSLPAVGSSPLPLEEAVQEALRLARWIYDQAVVLEGDERVWTGFEVLPDLARSRVRWMSSDFLDGRAGLGFLFAACFAVTKEGWCRSAALQAFGLRDESDTVTETRRRLLVQNPGWIGLGGTLFGLAQSAVWTEDLRLNREAHGLAEMLLARLDTPAAGGSEILGASGSSPLLKGAAGSAAGLSWAGSILSQPLWREAAVRLASRAITETDTSAAEPGARGDAGTALALLRVYRDSGEQDLLSRAVRLLGSSRRSNCDGQESEEDRSRDMDGSWWNGRLAEMPARALAAQLLDARGGAGPSQRTGQARLMPWDDLAHGNSGQIDVQLSMATLLNEPERTTAAGAQAAAMSARSQADGRYVFAVSTSTRRLALGLHHGAAGVAYSLLRLGANKSLPSLLSLGADGDV